MQPSLHLPERTRRDLLGRPTVATNPVRHTVGGFIHGLSCVFVGHRWVEASRTARRENGRRKIRFKCSRCNMLAGFTN
jgi:hypothetical protein